MVYELSEVVKRRRSDDAEFRLVVPKLTISDGEKIALVGPSGCGKSTLLDILAMVLSPTKARVFRFSTKNAHTADIAAIWQQRQLNKLSRLRKRHVGYILQTGGLLPYITVRENIKLSRKLLGISEDGTLDELASELGIRSHFNRLPSELSVGERQRVAIARALVHRPSVVLADEPTASLDPVTAKKTMTLLVRLIEELGLTVVIASHDDDFLQTLGLQPLQQTFTRGVEGGVIESEFTV